MILPRAPSSNQMKKGSHPFGLPSAVPPSVNISAPAPTALLITPASHPSTGAAPQAGLALAGGRKTTSSSGAQPRPRSSERSHVMPGSTPDVPSAPQYTEDSPAAAFSDVLDSFSAPPGGENPATLHLFSSASLPPAPTPGTEAAVKGADSSAQAGGLTSGSGSKMPNAIQEAASKDADLRAAMDSLGGGSI